jgi:dTDP-4-dehydrorhamnose 3,5-epimerase-like enzyme
MNISRTAVADVLIIQPKKFEDARGFFAPVYQQSALQEAGVTHDRTTSRCRGARARYAACISSVRHLRRPS